MLYLRACSGVFWLDISAKISDVNRIREILFYYGSLFAHFHVHDYCNGPRELPADEIVEENNNN